MSMLVLWLPSLVRNEDMLDTPPPACSYECTQLLAPVSDQDVLFYVSVAAAAPAYPSSSRKAKNWDALEKEAAKDEEKADGDKALNQLFAKIYKDSDDNTKRAMMKSFTESNGTCLSTNWDEVGKAPVETRPPEGMVAKKVRKQQHGVVYTAIKSCLLTHVPTGSIASRSTTFRQRATSFIEDRIEEGRGRYFF